jgi:N-acetylglucosamine-6-sulfatase
MARKASRTSPRKAKQRNNNLLIILLLLIGIVITIIFLRYPTIIRNNAQTASKPNFLVIMTDDQRWDEMETLPTVTERLASRGATFTNGFITNPLCCPSRSSFLSSLYSHNTNVWGNNGDPRGGWQEFRDNEAETIAVWMRNAGYKTGLFGKYMNGYGNAAFVPPGWSNWFAMVGGQGFYDYVMSDNGTKRAFGSKAAAYSTDVARDKAITFIKEAQDPFFLVYTPVAPHSPSQSAPRYSGTCDNFTQWQVPPSFNEADVSDKPKWVRQLNKKSLSVMLSERNKRLCSLKAVDDAVGKMLDTLESQGELENTVVIFYTDNGYALGEHRYVHKRCFYEACIRTPLVISYPKMFPAGKTINGFALNIDLAPTIAELAGVTIPVTINGRSLVPLLQGTTDSVRDEILLEVQNDDYNFRGTGVRTKEYKYIELYSGERELYNLTQDPDELQNQINNPAYQTVIQTLAARLAQLRAE